MGNRRVIASLTVGTTTWERSNRRRLGKARTSLVPFMEKTSGFRARKSTLRLGAWPSKLNGTAESRFSLRSRMTALGKETMVTVSSSHAARLMYTSILVPAI